MEFQITPDALEFMRKESEGSSLRFFTKKSWIGYVFDWVRDNPKEFDSEFEFDGVTIVMAPKDMSMSRILLVRMKDSKSGKELAISTVC